MGSVARLREGWMGIGTIVGWAVALTAAAGLASHYSAKQAAAVKEARAQRTADLRRKREELTAFIEAQADWQPPTRCTIAGSLSLLMLDHGGHAVRMLSYRDDPSFEVLNDLRIACADIYEVAVEERSETISFTKRESVPVTHTERRSPVARGLVGLAVLGPAGAVIGAASGLATNTRTTTEIRKVREHRTVEGAPNLVICRDDPTSPILRIQFSGHDDARDWALRLTRCIDQSPKAQPQL